MAKPPNDPIPALALLPRLALAASAFSFGVFLTAIIVMSAMGQAGGLYFVGLAFWGILTAWHLTKK